MSNVLNAVKKMFSIGDLKQAGTIIISFFSSVLQI